MNSEIIWRLGAFLGALILFSLWEAYTPRRERKIARNIRWSRNYGLAAISQIAANLANSLAVRFFIPIAAAASAVWASNNNIGLLNQFEISPWLSVPLMAIFLDGIIYAQHVLFHWHPWLWRLHMIHHVDQELDVSSGIRFHPVEIILSLFIKVFFVVVLGIPFMAVVIFEIILNVSAMFNHGNIALPLKIDRQLRKLIVTPDMHRVHHSVLPKETHSNFGFNLAIWDRLFGTYVDQPSKGHEAMSLGLPDYENVEQTGLIWMLKKPFSKK